MTTAKDNPLIVCVDDETHVLSSLERMLRREPYEVVTTDDPDEVLQFVEQRDVRVLIVDQRMPKMKGTDLLMAVQERSPRTIGILLSGAVGLDEVGTAVKDGLIHRIVYKPWDADELKEMIRAILATEESASPVRGSEVNRQHLLLKHQRQNVELLQAGFDVLPLAVAILSADGSRIAYANPRMAVALGMEPSDLTGATAAAYFPAEICQRAHLIGQSGAGSVETTFSPPGGAETFHLQRLGRTETPLGVMLSIDGEVRDHRRWTLAPTSGQSRIRMNCDRMTAADLLEDLGRLLRQRRPEGPPLQIVIDRLDTLADPVDGFLRNLSRLLKETPVDVTFTDPRGLLREIIARAAPDYPHRIADRA